MTQIIAVAGKGGTGKTTVAALLVRELIQRGKTPLLVIDADPVANLGPALGIVPGKTIGEVEQEFFGAKLTLPAGMSKESFLNLRLNEAITESRGLDLLVMGQSEGPGCYCTIHNLMANFLDRLAGNYQYLVVDNEAGMEHLSRKTVPRIDQLLLVSDPTLRGLRTVKTILNLVDGLKLQPAERWLVIDRGPRVLPPEIREAAGSLGIEFLGVIPEDAAITQLDLSERPVVDLPDDSPAVQEWKKMFSHLIH